MRECRLCGKPINRRNKNFCSPECWYRWLSQYSRQRVTKQCELCGVTFETIPCRAARFCSQRCYGKWQGKQKAGRSRGGTISKVCEWCGRKFNVYRARELKTNARFCSRKCLSDWKSANWTGANAPAWRGGTSFEPYPLEFNRSFKRKIKARDNHKCMACGEKGQMVHHINYIKADTRSENCITLCNSCHSKTNGSREFWQEYLYGCLTRL
ncbi:MAG: HNH endonuclease [Chloroflexi bacterium]|nr:HNH endonuclease [Chloroflexota bacterium]